MPNPSSVLSPEAPVEQPGRIKTIGYAAQSATSPLTPFSFERRTPGPLDVQIDILYCGVCHSDLHTVRNEWTNSVYPVVPGHEIIGRVTKVGSKVRKFKEGDLAAVGCMVDSDRVCESCKADLEQYCETGPTFTYNSEDKHLGGMTYGGYSKSIVVDEAFVLRPPTNLDPAATAPLLCAGITTYSPLRHWKVGKGQRVGIVGLGGLGHMGVKLAQCVGRACDAVHHVGAQDRSRQAPGRTRGRALEGSGTDGEARQELRLHPRHGVGRARYQRLSEPAEARWNVGA